MIQVDISKGIKVGGFDYTVNMTEAGHRGLLASGLTGECDNFNKQITVDPHIGETYISETFIHEVIEAVNHIFCNDKIEHEKITQLGFGIHQVMESLNVRFGGK